MVRLTVLVEWVSLLSEDLLLGIAVCLGDGVSGQPTDLRLWVLNDLSALDVESLDLADCVSRTQELGDHGELGVRVDRLAWTVEVLDADTIRVVITSVGITVAGVAVIGIRTTTAAFSAHSIGLWIARVGGKGGGNGVCLPDVHLGAGVKSAK